MPHISEYEVEDIFIDRLEGIGYKFIKLDNYDDVLANFREQLAKFNAKKLAEKGHDASFSNAEFNRIMIHVDNHSVYESAKILRDKYVLQLDNGESVYIDFFSGDTDRNIYQVTHQVTMDKAHKDDVVYKNRYDVTVLINGLPLVQIELKRHGVEINEAINQINRYRKFSFKGIFRYLQLFVVSNSVQTKYFCNENEMMDGQYNPILKSLVFFWTDEKNTRINDLNTFTGEFFRKSAITEMMDKYMVIKTTEPVLMVMRPYQIYAVKAAKKRVLEVNQDGYVFACTGSGKTLTSFKLAQLLRDESMVDLVVFLIDRKDLDDQAVDEYNSFEKDCVDNTDSTAVLINMLKSSEKKMIVTTIQKMANAVKNPKYATVMDAYKNKKVVFIIDEAHRDVFGEMLRTIKETFPNAMFFGFTGTPIHDENQKKMSTTSDVFGNELHRYSIADGIRDKNVLGFDPYMVPTYKDRDLRKAVALERAKATTEAEALADPKKKKVYLHYMDHTKVPMAGYVQADGSYLKGIEDYLPVSQYEREEHQCAVVDDILENWTTLSHDSKFHAIFATSSIPEAIQYYKLFKAKGNLKITALFDPSIDNNGNGLFKEEGIVEIIEDYNTRYGMKFQMATYATFKKDISYRLAHKEQYKGIEHTSDQQIDLLIVVDQMLTGFDSKWINTLYLDKILVYEKLIQAFSRTNRLYGPEKPFGTIRYYRKPYTMQRNIEEAFKLYSGDRPLGLFADKLEHNLEKMNALYDDIGSIFRSAGIENFEKLPVDHTERGQFAKLFKQLNSYLEAAKIQGFTWDKLSYEFKNAGRKVIVNLRFDETTYLILALRYKELFAGGSGGDGVEDVPYEIDSYLTEINTGVIDANYMNSRFKKYIKALQDGAETAAVLDELHKSFATLTQEEQKYANIFLHDVQNADVVVEGGKTLRDYITEYMTSAKNDQIHRFATAIGVDETMLRSFMQSKITEANINEFGKFDTLKATVDTEKTKTFLEMMEGKPIKKFQINMKIDQMLRRFILEGGFDVE